MQEYSYREKKGNNIGKNYGYQVLYEVVKYAAPLIISPYIARVIGAEGIGTYTYSYSIAYYFVLFSMLGIQNYGNRSIAKVRDNKESLDSVFSSVFFLHVIISFSILVLYCCFVHFLWDGNLFGVLQIVYVVSAFFDISWFYFGIEEFRLIFQRNLIIKLLNLVSIFLLVRTESDL